MDFYPPGLTSFNHSQMLPFIYLLFRQCVWPAICRIEWLYYYDRIKTWRCCEIISDAMRHIHNHNNILYKICLTLPCSVVASIYAFSTYVSSLLLFHLLTARNLETCYAQENYFKWKPNETNKKIERTPESTNESAWTTEKIRKKNNPHTWNSSALRKSHN